MIRYQLLSVIGSLIFQSCFLQSAGAAKLRGLESTSCSLYPACSGLTGSCCPNLNNLFMSCCYVVVPPIESDREIDYEFLQSGTEDPTSNELVSDVPSTSPVEVPTGTILSDFSSDLPSISSSDAPSDVSSDLPSVSPSDFPSYTPSDLPSSQPSTMPLSFASDLPSDIPSTF